MKGLQDIFFSNLNAVINNGGFICIKPQTSWYVDWHRFNQHKFYYITKGSCTIGIEEKEYIACAGDWFFIPANTLHYYNVHNEEDFEKFWVHFDIYPMDADLFQILELPYCIHIEGEEDVPKLFADLSGRITDTLTDKLYSKADLLQLIARYITLAQKSNVIVKGKDDDRLDDILRYINDNLDKSLTLNMLSDFWHLHPNHFIRYFKDKTGQTPMYYIRCRRMDKAKRLLEETDLSIAEIMQKIGFEEVGYFSKQFKNFYSMSPREYRKYYQFHLLPAKEQLNGQYDYTLLN